MNIDSIHKLAIDLYALKSRRFTELPYISHPVRVMTFVKKYGNFNDPEREYVCSAAALLHDVIEDECISTVDLMNKLMEIDSKNALKIMCMVNDLTLSDYEVKEYGKAKAIIRKTQMMSRDCLLVKLCDRLDNVNDLVLAPVEFVKKYIRETDEVIGRIDTQNSVDLQRVCNMIIHRTYILKKELGMYPL